MEDKLNYEEKIRNDIRRGIIRRNQLRAPICYEAQRMLDKVVEIEIENSRYIIEYNQTRNLGGNY